MSAEQCRSCQKVTLFWAAALPVIIGRIDLNCMAAICQGCSRCIGTIISTSDGRLVMALPVTLLPLSMVIPIVSGLTPESLSVTFQRIAGLLLMISALAVGYVIVIAGAVFPLRGAAGCFREWHLCHFLWSCSRPRPWP